LGGGNWSLTAMLEFTKTDFDKIISQYSKHETPNKQKVPNSYLFGLLPESIQQQYSDKKSEEYIYVDTYTIAPDAFVDVNKSPLVNGDAVVFEDEHVIFAASLYDVINKDSFNGSTSGRTKVSCTHAHMWRSKYACVPI
jgi:hypothetical protein